jgi:enoyl-CoA hydratase
MAELVTYEERDGVALVTMDDGKANALSHGMLEALMGAFDRAEHGAKALVLHGREGRFCAGFDLRTMMSGVEQAKTLVSRGADVLLRLYGLGLPVVVACSGHALAAGALVLLAADTRFGADGDFKIGLNETSIAMPLPLLARELARDRLDPRQLTQATIQGKIFSPAEAAEVGYLDRVTGAAALLGEALAEAGRLGALPRSAYATTKAGMREATLRLIRDTFVEDMNRLLPPAT